LLGYLLKSWLPQNENYQLCLLHCILKFHLLFDCFISHMRFSLFLKFFHPCFLLLACHFFTLFLSSYFLFPSFTCNSYYVPFETLFVWNRCWQHSFNLAAAMRLSRLEVWVGRERISDGKKIKFRPHIYFVILAYIRIEDTDVCDFRSSLCSTYRSIQFRFSS
jgi:hypothetical protein